MAGKEFVILYTHQKNKKSKRWQDGVLKLSVHGNRAVLYDDTNTSLDALYIKPEQIQCLIGEQLESDKYLITVEEQKTASRNIENANPTSSLRQQHQVSTLCTNPLQVLPQRPPLKRRRMGFTVPRQIVRTTPLQSNNVPVSSSSNDLANPDMCNASQSTKPSLFNSKFSKKSTLATPGSFFNMYGKSENKTSGVSYTQPGKNLYASVNNTQTSSLLEDETDCNSKSFDDIEPVTAYERFEDSLVPTCFEATTPSTSIGDSRDSLQYINSNHNASLDIIDSFQARKQKENIESQNQVNFQTCPQVSADTFHSQPDEARSGKRSASQILALLGRSSGSFKPPVKASQVPMLVSQGSANNKIHPGGQSKTQSGLCNRQAGENTAQLTQQVGNVNQSPYGTLAVDVTVTSSFSTHQGGSNDECGSMVSSQERNVLQVVDTQKNNTNNGSTPHTGWEKTASSGASQDKDMKETQSKILIHDDIKSIVSQCKVSPRTEIRRESPSTQTTGIGLTIVETFQDKDVDEKQSTILNYNGIKSTVLPCKVSPIMEIIQESPGTEITGIGLTIAKTIQDKDVDEKQSEILNHSGIKSTVSLCNVSPIPKIIQESPGTETTAIGLTTAKTIQDKNVDEKQSEILNHSGIKSTVSLCNVSPIPKIIQESPGSQTTATGLTTAKTIQDKNVDEKQSEILNHSGIKSTVLPLNVSPMFKISQESLVFPTTGTELTSTKCLRTNVEQNHQKLQSNHMIPKIPDSQDSNMHFTQSQLSSPSQHDTNNDIDNESNSSQKLKTSIGTFYDILHTVRVIDMSLKGTKPSKNQNISHQQLDVDTDFQVTQQSPDDVNQTQQHQEPTYQMVTKEGFVSSGYLKLDLPQSVILKDTENSFMSFEARDGQTPSEMTHEDSETEGHVYSAFHSDGSVREINASRKNKMAKTLPDNSQIGVDCEQNMELRICRIGATTSLGHVMGPTNDLTPGDLRSTQIDGDGIHQLDSFKETRTVGYCKMSEFHCSTSPVDHDVLSDVHTYSEDTCIENRKRQKEYKCRQVGRKSNCNMNSPIHDDSENMMQDNHAQTLVLDNAVFCEFSRHLHNSSTDTFDNVTITNTSEGKCVDTAETVFEKKAQCVSICGNINELIGEDDDGRHPQKGLDTDCGVATESKNQNKGDMVNCNLCLSAELEILAQKQEMDVADCADTDRAEKILETCMRLDARDMLQVSGENHESKIISDSVSTNKYLLKCQNNHQVVGKSFHVVEDDLVSPDSEISSKHKSEATFNRFCQIQLPSKEFTDIFEENNEGDGNAKQKLNRNTTCSNISIRKASSDSSAGEYDIQDKTLISCSIFDSNIILDSAESQKELINKCSVNTQEISEIIQLPAVTKLPCEGSNKLQQLNASNNQIVAVNNSQHFDDKKEVLDTCNLLSSVLSQSSTATSVDTLDIPLSLDQNVALTAKLDSKISQLLSEDGDEDLVYKEVIISDGNRDGMVPDSHVFREDISTVQNEDFAVPQVAVENVYQTDYTCTSNQMVNFVNCRKHVTDVDVELAENSLGFRQDNRMHVQCESQLDDSVQCVPDVSAAHIGLLSNNAHSCGGTIHTGTDQGYQCKTQLHRIGQPIIDREITNSKHGSDFINQPFKEMPRSSVYHHNDETEDFPWISRNCSRAQTSWAPPLCAVGNTDNESWQDGRIVAEDLPFRSELYSQATPRCDEIHKDHCDQTIPGKLRQTVSDRMHQTGNNSTEAEGHPHPPLMNTALYPCDMKDFQKSMRQTEKVSSGVKLNRREKKGLHYWRKPVSSETIKRCPRQATFESAVARRQDLQHVPAPFPALAFNGHSPDIPLWNDCKAATTMPFNNTKIPGMYLYEAGVISEETRQGPSLNLASLHKNQEVLQGQNNRQTYASCDFLLNDDDNTGEYCTPMRATWNNEIPSVLSVQDIGHFTPYTPIESNCQRSVSLYGDKIFRENQNAMQMYQRHVLVNDDDNKSKSCITPVSSNWNDKIPLVLNRKDTARFIPFTPSIESTQIMESLPPHFTPHLHSPPQLQDLSMDSDKFCTINITSEGCQPLSPGIMKSPISNETAAFQKTAGPVSPVTEVTNALQLFASPQKSKLLSPQSKSSENIFIDEEVPRTTEPLGAESRMSVRLSESQEDMFLPDTQHTLEMFSQMNVTPSSAVSVYRPDSGLNQIQPSLSYQRPTDNVSASIFLKTKETVSCSVYGDTPRVDVSNTVLTYDGCPTIRVPKGCSSEIQSNVEVHEQREKVKLQKEHGDAAPSSKTGHLLALKWEQNERKSVLIKKGFSTCKTQKDCYLGVEGLPEEVIDASNAVKRNVAKFKYGHKDTTSSSKIGQSCKVQWKRKKRKPLISQVPKDTHITPFSFSSNSGLDKDCHKNYENNADHKVVQGNTITHSLSLKLPDSGNFQMHGNKDVTQGESQHIGSEQLSAFPFRFKTQSSSREDNDRDRHRISPAFVDRSLIDTTLNDINLVPDSRHSRRAIGNSLVFSTVPTPNRAVYEAGSSVINPSLHVDKSGFSQVQDSLGTSSPLEYFNSSLDRVLPSLQMQSSCQQVLHRTVGPYSGMTASISAPYDKQSALINPEITTQNGTITQSSRKVQSARPASVRKCKGFQNPTMSSQGFSQRNVCGEFFFPSSQEIQDSAIPQRQVRIPVVFSNAAMYKQLMIGALKEHINLLLHKLAMKYHTALSKIDLTGYAPATGHARGGMSQTASTSNSPMCEHATSTKMVCVKKEGPNKGRFFYVCSSARGNQCKFFMWADQYKDKTSSNNSNQSGNSQPLSSRVLALSDSGSITTYFKSHHVALYCQCHLVRKIMNSYNSLPNVPAWVQKYKQQDVGKKKLYLKLSHKAISSMYAKDDLWVISQQLTFDPSCTFLAKSIYHGPSSSNEIEIEPVSTYSPSNWASGCMVHALHVGNVSSELTCISNIEEHINPRTLPVLQHILDGNKPKDQASVGGFRPPTLTRTAGRMLHCTDQQVVELAEQVITKYGLNTDQAEAVQRVVAMFIAGRQCKGDAQAITLIHGVFGAGKSFLLAVTVLFLVQLFELSDKQENGNSSTSTTEWKLLIASTTNVAVDRILSGLLELGFEHFIRVGSVRKIDKQVLPYSVHAADKEKQELSELQQMLKTDITPAEKQLVRMSIERQRLGRNKELLSRVKVVGVTCAACTFKSLSFLKFPVVLLDECSQMTEPASLLPIARFACEKLVLIGDPKQLDPTIQGTEPGHNASLEQTLFDRLLIMGYEPIMLRTQYRCHPKISVIASSLFYDNQLIDGVSEQDRPTLADGFPTLCIYNVSNGQEVCALDGSFYNDQEATFVVFLIEALIVCGLQPCSIGVITLYKAQMRKIQQMLLSSSVNKASDMKSIQISTVDAFQGGEKGIIILSSVRTDYMGFADSDKRTNVALTRAKNHLLIVGNLRILTENTLWGQVVEKCKEYPDGIESSHAFTRQWKDKIIEAHQARDSQKKTNTKKQTNDSTGAKNNNRQPFKQTGSVHSENQATSVSDVTEEPTTPCFGISRSAVVETEDCTPGNASYHSSSSPSYSPLDHVVPSDNESDEELPSFNISE